jgi:hypothetical protein
MRRPGFDELVQNFLPTRSVGQSLSKGRIAPIYLLTRGAESTMTDDLKPRKPQDSIDLYLADRENELSYQTHRTHRGRLGNFAAWCDERVSTT